MKLCARSLFLLHLAAVVTCLIQSASALKVDQSHEDDTLDDNAKICSTSSIPSSWKKEPDSPAKATSKDVDLAQIANLATYVKYGFQEPWVNGFDGYELKQHWNIKSDGTCNNTFQAGIYRNKKNECVLAFSGGEKLATGYSKKTMLTPNHVENYCKIGLVQAGFAQAADLYLDGKKNGPFMRYLSRDGPGKCKTVTFTGHGYAGAVAGIIAQCAQHQSKKLKVDYLFTFGSPAPAKVQLMNRYEVSKGSEEGCFKGLRVYNEDLFTGDDLPGKWASLGYVHPKLPSARLKEIDHDIETRYDFCNTDSSRLDPSPTKHRNVTAGEDSTYVTRLLRYTRVKKKDEWVNHLINVTTLRKYQN